MTCGICETLTPHRGVTVKPSGFVRVQSQAQRNRLSRRRCCRSALGRPLGHSIFQSFVCPVALRRGERQPRMSKTHRPGEPLLPGSEIVYFEVQTTRPHPKNISAKFVLGAGGRLDPQNTRFPVMFFIDLPDSYDGGRPLRVG